MYKTTAEAAAFAGEIVNLVREATDDVDVVICGPFTALPTLQAKLNGSTVKWGAQNMFWADQGAFTGEISPQMLLELGCSHVIIGHSERRDLFGETDEMVAKKVKSALEHGLTPIICVGENLTEWEAGKTGTKVKAQVVAALSLLDAAEVARVVIAYEPIWAIGTGRTASVGDASIVAALIRKTVGEQFGVETAETLRVLYGGSVKPENIRQFMQNPLLDGALVGGASLEAVSFAKIVHNSRG